MDATVIDLCATVFDWAQFRRTQGSGETASVAGPRRLPALLCGDHRGQTSTRSRVARQLRYEPGTVLVFDRGYNDYDWFADLTSQGSFSSRA